MEEFLQTFGLLALWAVFALIGRLGQKGKQGKQAPPRPERPGTAVSRPTTMEDLLAEMRGELDRAKQHEDTTTIEPEWEYDDDEEEAIVAEPQYHRPEESPSWNTTRQEGSDSWNEPVVVVSRDDEGRLDVARRIAEAEARNRAWQLADHKAFDIRIRAPKVAPDAAAQLANHRRLRDAIILSEVLGPPKGLRED